MAQPSVFLSHSVHDAAFAERLKTDLQAAGATVYLVSTSQGGNFQKRIDEALSACEWMVVVLTKDALASSWVEQEVYAANRLKHQGRIRDILPIQASPVNQRDIPPLWGVYNVLDAVQNYMAARDAILRALGLNPTQLPTARADNPNDGNLNNAISDEVDEWDEWSVSDQPTLSLPRRLLEMPRSPYVESGEQTFWPPRPAGVPLSTPSPASRFTRPASMQRKAVLVVRQGKEPGRAFELRKDVVIIGRDRDSDIFLEDLAVSRRNTTVSRDERGRYTIRDENSANGTYVNNQRISQQWLEDGDEIQIGQSVFAFSMR